MLRHTVILVNISLILSLQSEIIITYKFPLKQEIVKMKDFGAKTLCSLNI